MSLRKITSIKEYAIRYSIVIFVVIFVATGAHYLLYSDYLEDLYEDDNQKSLEYTANNVSRLLDFYQSVVDNLSLQARVMDLLQFGTNEEVQQWANEMQRILPESIGLALFDAEGRVMGVRERLRLSDRCLSDMHKRFKGLPVPQPPVHHKIERLAHFDVISPVYADGEKIGLVFASFSLNTVKNLLDDLVSKNQQLFVITPEEYLVASAVKGNHTKYHATYKKVIDGTDWKMELKSAREQQDVFLRGMLMSDLVIFLTISGLLYWAMKHLFNLVVSDFEILSWMMQRIKLGTYQSDDIHKVKLEESKSIIRFIQYTAEELNTYQNKLRHDSETDELTQLYNRRVLNEKLDDYLALANSGSDIYLTIIDMDKFKEINDSYGHEAGDEVLKILAKSLKTISRGNDLCVRAGGDEFIIVLVDYKSYEVKAWYEKLCRLVNESSRALKEKYSIPFEFGISAGTSQIRNDDNRSAVLKRADDALYEVKAKGRNHLISY